MEDLEYWKQKARESNAQGHYMAVGLITGTKLEKLFGDNHAAAYRFYTALEQEAPTYNPMQGD